jgi:hypothetical protein
MDRDKLAYEAALAVAEVTSQRLPPAGDVITCESIARAVFAAIEAQGFAIVPVEPDGAVTKAGVDLAMRIRLSPEYSWRDYMTDLYRAMITAARSKPNE